MSVKEKYTNHNGKEVKVYDGVSVRVSSKAYNTIRGYCNKKGLKIGKFVEQACLETIKQTHLK